MRNNFETVMKTSSLHFSFGQVFLRSAKLYSALTIGKRSTPLPCYGKRIFSVTPQVGEITTEYAPLWQNATLPKYSFNAKELDEETGMYYYEARYYKPPVFTSRDPMFEKYFWMTPYAYCANNPVGRVDPSGMMDGDYFDWNGNYLGWDGNDDDMVHFVSDSKSIENIKNKENIDGFTPTNDVSIDVSVSRSFILEGPIDVYNRTENNGNTKEEATFFPLEGGEPIRRTGKSIFSITWDEEPTVSVPNVPLDKTVHSHLSYTRKNLEYGIQKQCCALTPSDNPSGPADVIYWPRNLDTICYHAHRQKPSADGGLRQQR